MFKLPDEYTTSDSLDKPGKENNALAIALDQLAPPNDYCFEAGEVDADSIVVPVEDYNKIVSAYNLRNDEVTGLLGQLKEANESRKESHLRIHALAEELKETRRQLSISKAKLPEELEQKLNDIRWRCSPALGNKDVKELLFAEIVRDCAKVCTDLMLSPEDEDYDNKTSVKVGEGTYYNNALEGAAKRILFRYGLTDEKKGGDK